MDIFKKLKRSLFGLSPSSKSKAKKKSKVKAKPVKKAAKKPAKKSPTRSKGKGKIAAKPAKEKIQGKLIGLVTHYFPQVNAAVVKIDRSNLVVGDRVHIKGHTTDFKQTLNSLQIDRKPIEKAGKGDEIGVEVKARVRIGDEVYKL